MIPSSTGMLAVAGAVWWIVWSVACGYLAHRTPRARLEHDGPLLRIRDWERDGRAYEQIDIKAWKDRLPEAGDLFKGGFSKRHARYDRDYLERLLVETRRAELAHWAMLSLAPTFFLWVPAFGMPWWLAMAMFAYGVIANVPCLIVQRYNRGRLVRILSP